MEERRQAFRRASITIELSDDFSIVVEPIPWEQRTDFGNEVISQHVGILNEAVRLYTDPDTGVPQLEAKLAEKFSDPQRLMELGLSSETYEKLKTQRLYSNQIVEILLTIVEVNELSQLKALIDPNSTTPTMLGGIVSGLMSGSGDTQRTGSGLDSSSPDSIETPSEASPSPSLVPPSTSSPE